jgi:PII-like signaling protein
MNGTYLRFYTYENVQHQDKPLFRWLLEHAKGLGIHGGSAFRAFRGFGRDGALHAQHSFKRARDLTVEVEFVVSDAMADRLLKSLDQEDLSLVYARSPTQFGVLDARQTNPLDSPRVPT